MLAHAFVRPAPPLPRRRFFALPAALGMVAASVGGCAVAPARARGPTVVLVHGAWYGGWCWSKLVPRLTDAGCSVYTPTLTGLGDRAHLAGRDTTLETHVRDIRALLATNDLRDIVLVGHSYGGMVISRIAELERARIRRLVFLDAFVPDDGKRVVDYLLPIERRDTIVKVGTETGFVPPIPALALGVTDAADRAWMDALAVKQPFGTFAEAVHLAAPAGNGLPCAYIACVEPASGSFGQFAQKVRSLAGWTYAELRTGHNAMVTAPAAVAASLMAVMRSRPRAST